MTPCRRYVGMYYNLPFQYKCDNYFGFLSFFIYFFIFVFIRIIDLKWEY